MLFGLVLVCHDLVGFESILHGRGRRVPNRLVQRTLKVLRLLLCLLVGFAVS